MGFREAYQLWATNDYFDEATRQELLSVRDNEKEIEDRFYKELEFGTGGMRGVIGAGSNRINKYTVRKAAQAFANYIKKEGLAGKGVVIAYDSRRCSREFAMETAQVMAANGIKAYLFDELRPTPELSFAVRHLNCAGGVVITASHNPKEYNGFKAYRSDGCQLPPKEADAVTLEFNAINDITTIRPMPYEEATEKGLIEIIGKEIDDAYINEIRKVQINADLCLKYGKEARIIFTPLHGTGNKPVRRILKEIGFENVYVVPQQEHPDPEFSTVEYPNPEEKSAFEIAISMAKDMDVDLIIGTDPDADRMGVVVRDDSGQYITLTGNQIGCLILEYILSQKKQKGDLPENAFVVKTIVSSDLARKIADNYGVELIDVLTGFKFIGEKIGELDDTGRKKFLFGFEESYGYLAGTHARDKDAVVSAMMLAEVYAWYKSRSMNLYQGLIEIFNKYGFVREGIDSFTLKGKEGLEKISRVMETLREQSPVNFGEFKVSSICDYKKGYCLNLSDGSTSKIDLPKSNVLFYRMVSGDWFCIRPSGTEPKIKIYYGITSDSLENAENKLSLFKNEILGDIRPLLD